MTKFQITALHRFGLKPKTGTKGVRYLSILWSQYSIIWIEIRSGEADSRVSGWIKSYSRPDAARGPAVAHVWFTAIICVMVPQTSVGDHRGGREEHIVSRSIMEEQVRMLATKEKVVTPPMDIRNLRKIISQPR
ncbi:hypothetical protein EVAR_93407_1 [Eumeta japonica]|uniref:Uncharacterized protein n=1 Tax=Eumeta variegata TaxID=151549 RepID=A0A4C1UQG7_EUMVA|nr:hypothetical protein EVAR_93407_1 [Eumeta japonica]